MKRRFIAWLKWNLGFCPMTGCWNEATGSHVGMCYPCWTFKGPTAEDVLRERWLEQCAARFRKFARVHKGRSMVLAQAALDSCNGNLSEDPELVADEEMATWRDDSR